MEINEKTNEMPQELIEEVQNKIIHWYRTENTRNFIWRRFIFTSSDTIEINDHEINRRYALFIVEFMLIRTKAEQVEPIYTAFLRKFNSFEAIANTDKEVLRFSLENLGLHRRVDQLKHIAEDYKEKDLPKTLDELLEIRGIGFYTASAFSCFVNRQRVPLVDSNFVRIYCRVFGIRENVEIRRNKIFIQFCEILLPKENFQEFNLGILDLGSDVCTPSPNCDICPVAGLCQYNKFMKFLEKDIDYLVIPFFDQSGMKNVLSNINKIMMNNEKLIVFYQVQNLGKRAKAKAIRLAMKPKQQFKSRFWIDKDLENPPNLEPGLYLDSQLFVLKENEIKESKLWFWRQTSNKEEVNEWLGFFEKLLSNN